jgi:hypothetical protein
MLPCFIPPQVSNSPQVHSNGFHICFDLAADATLGYILPTWLEPHQRATAGTRTLFSLEHACNTACLASYLPHVPFTEASESRYLIGAVLAGLCLRICCSTSCTLQLLHRRPWGHMPQYSLVTLKQSCLAGPLSLRVCLVATSCAL